MSQKIENLLLFLTLLLLPTTLGWHFWPQFAYVLSFPINYLSPTIYYFDLAVVLLLLISLLKRKKVLSLPLNLLLIFILSQVMSLLPSLLPFPVNLGAGIVRIEQYVIAGLFGVYLSSRKFDNKVLWGLSLYASAIILARLISPVEKEQFLQIGIKIFSSSPILGIGLNNLIPYSMDHLLLAPERSLVPIHNIYLLTLVETGLIGFFGTLGVFGVAVWLSLKKLPLLLLWIIIIMVGMFDHFFLTEPAGLRTLFLIWGVSLSANKSS